MQERRTELNEQEQAAVDALVETRRGFEEERKQISEDIIKLYSEYSEYSDETPSPENSQNNESRIIEICKVLAALRSNGTRDSFLQQEIRCKIASLETELVRILVPETNHVIHQSDVFNRP